MAVVRIDWENLPREVRGEIRARTGPIRSARTVADGKNSAVAAILTTASGRVFVKALPTDHPRCWTQDREAEINPAVRHLSPALLWRVRTAGWDCLGFEVFDGPAADYTPGSPDLPAVVSTLAELGEMRAPDVEMKTAPHRWRSYVTSPRDSEVFDGVHLLHTDWNPENVLISGGRAVLLDWAWPTRGAGWIDPACLIVRLVAAGHGPDEAERLLAPVPAWRDAPAAHVLTFAEASAHMWQEIANGNPAPWAREMNRAAASWRDHRAELTSAASKSRRSRT